MQDTWGKSSGWLTAVDVDGEACLGPPQGPAAPPGYVEGGAYEEDDSGRGNWLKPEFQHENWTAKHLPKYDHIEGQQERDERKRMQWKQQQHRGRQEHATGAAGKKSVVEARGGGPGAGLRSAAAMRSR